MITPVVDRTVEPQARVRRSRPPKAQNTSASMGSGDLCSTLEKQAPTMHAGLWPRVRKLGILALAAQSGLLRSAHAAPAFGDGGITPAPAPGPGSALQAGVDDGIMLHYGRIAVDHTLNDAFLNEVAPYLHDDEDFKTLTASQNDAPLSRAASLTLVPAAANTSFDETASVLRWNQNQTHNVISIDDAGDADCGRQSPALSVARAVKYVARTVNTTATAMLRALPSVLYGSQLDESVANATNTLAARLKEPLQSFGTPEPTVGAPVAATQHGTTCTVPPASFQQNLQRTAGATAEGAQNLADVVQSFAQAQSTEAQARLIASSSGAETAEIAQAAAVTRGIRLHFGDGLVLAASAAEAAASKNATAQARVFADAALYGARVRETAAA